MDLSGLQHALDQVLGTMVAGTNPIPNQDPVFKADYQAGRFDSVIRAGSEAVVVVMQDIPELQMFNGQMMVFGNSAGLVQLSNLAHSLITRAFDVGAAQTITDLERYVTQDSFAIRQMYFIGGVTLSESIELADDIHLIPFNFRNEEHRRLIPNADDVDWAVAETTTVALVKYRSHPRRHQQPKDLLVYVREVWDFAELDDAFRCMALIGPSGAAIVGRSITSKEWIPLFKGTPPGRVSARAPVGVDKDLTKSDLAHLQEIYQNFTKHTPEFKKRLRIPMGRLNQAMRRGGGVDSAIDLGIALETLFSDSKPYDSSIGFSLRLRAARLLRTGKEERETLAKLVGSLYDLRSKAAHSGELPPSKRGQMESIEVLNQGVDLVTEAIEYFIRYGEPNWNDVVYS